MIATLFVLAIAAAPAAPVPAQAGPCPAPVMGPPRYPVEMMRSNVSGITLVLARVDECGRVLEPRVHTGSGHESLDAAALETVRAWVLSPAQRVQVGGPWVRLPVKFGGVQTVSPRSPAWPKSHRRPRYLPDETPFGFDTLQAFHDGRRFKPGVVLKSPYGSVLKAGVMTAFHEDRDDPTTFWLSYVIHQSGRTMGENTIAVARYRLVQEQGEPVVRLALLCEAPPEQCAELRGFLMKGLPIARPPRA